MTRSGPPTSRKTSPKPPRLAITGREDLVTKLDLERDVNRMQTEIGRVDNDLKAAIADLKADMKLLKFGYVPAILGLLIKLVFFP